MKKAIIILLIPMLIYISGHAQNKGNADALQQLVGKLDKAVSATDYQELEKQFSGLAATQKTAWLPYYYAALCNAKIGFIYQNNGEQIEPYSNKGEEQVKKALSLLDTSKQKHEQAEVYVVTSMIYRTKVFINPITYGRKYGVLANQYLDKAKELEPNNPRAIYLEAWVKYSTPKLWGGDKKLAKQLAEKSLATFTATSTDVNPHWGKAENQQLLKQYK